MNQVTFETYYRVGHYFYRYGSSFQPTSFRRYIGANVDRWRYIQVNRTSVFYNESSRTPNSRYQVFTSFCRANRPVSNTVEIASPCQFSGHQGGIVVRFAILVMYRQILLRTFYCRIVDSSCNFFYFQFCRRFRCIRWFTNVTSQGTGCNANLFRFSFPFFRRCVNDGNALRRFRWVFFFREFRYMRLATKGRQASGFREQVFNNNACRHSYTVFSNSRWQVLLKFTRPICFVSGRSETKLDRGLVTLNTVCRFTRVFRPKNGDARDMRKDFRLVNGSLNGYNLARSQESPGGG